ncbi:MAG: histidine phosphatase family protein [Bacteroidia bacterium]|nr:histidine phosphatase family protein [Bacteroidia bacterium]
MHDFRAGGPGFFRRFAPKTAPRMITLYLIRHAESEGNLNNHLIGGQSNHLPLTERGYDQARRLGERLRREGLRFDALHTSTAVRAAETGRILASHLDLDPDALPSSPLLVELGHGEWEGLVRKDVYTPELIARLRENPYDFKAPGGESQREVEARMWQWLESAVSAFAPETDAALAAVTHGMSIRVLIRRLLQADPAMTNRMVTHNTSITCLQQIPQGWLLERLNDFAHLAGTEMIGHY